jgi:hypothetical protein
MKKAFLVSYLVLLGTMYFTACATQPGPKLLDMDTITGEIPIYSVNLFVREDIDSNGLGKQFFQKFYTEYIEKLQKFMSGEGIVCDVQTFFDEYNSSPNIGFETIKMTPSSQVHHYFWNSGTRPEIRLELSLNLVILEDGTMPLTCTVIKDDPFYEPGYTAERIFGVVFLGKKS